MKKVSDDFQLEGQMSIFDLPFMQAPVSEELPGLKEIAELIGKKYSLYFAYRDRTKTKYAEFDCYEAKYMGGSITLDEGHYATRDERDGKRFIGVDAMYKTSGMSRSCDTMEEIEKVVKTSKECIAKWKNEEQRDKERKSVCKHSGHECNKENLWEVADSLDDTTCPHTCCRECSVKCCGARCNGSCEPVEQCDDNVLQKAETYKERRQKKADEEFAKAQRQDTWDRTHLQNIEPNGILPCENCGGIPRCEQFSSQDERWTIVCECGMESVRGVGRWLDLADTKQEAIDHWNKGYRHMNPLYKDKGKRSYDEMFKWDFDTYKDVPHMLSMFKRVINKKTKQYVEAYYQIERHRAGWQSKPNIWVNEKKKGYVSMHQYPTVQALVEEWDFPELEQWAMEHYEG